jgi:protein SMG6
MAVAIHVANHAVSDPTTSGGEPVPATVLLIEAPASRIDSSPLPSVGIPAAAAELGDEDERDTWRATARDWYAEVLKDTPGTGRLQYYLGTLSRDLKGEELRAMYHFVKR